MIFSIINENFIGNREFSYNREKRKQTFENFALLNVWNCSLFSFFSRIQQKMKAILNESKRGKEKNFLAFLN